MGVRKHTTADRGTAPTAERAASAVDRLNNRMARRRAAAAWCSRMARRVGTVVATAFLALTGVAAMLTAAEHYLEDLPEAAQPFVIDLCAEDRGGCRFDPAPTDAVGEGGADSSPAAPGVVAARAPDSSSPTASAGETPAVVGVGDIPADGGLGMGVMSVPSDEAGIDECGDEESVVAEPEPAAGDAAVEDCAAASAGAQADAEAEPVDDPIGANED